MPKRVSASHNNCDHHHHQSHNPSVINSSNIKKGSRLRSNSSKIMAGGNNKHHMNGNASLMTNGGDNHKMNGFSSKIGSNLPKIEDLVLWKSPVSTLKFFFLESIHLIKRFLSWLWLNVHFTLITISILGSVLFARQIDGSHQKYLAAVENKLLWCSYWVGLGILSSVGLGTGLHTFLLYLGPHIAAVTLAAHECGSLDFPEPPYPDEIICPDDGVSDAQITLWQIMSKVRLEAFMWGAGTAIGELPPYFMARAARLSGQGEFETETEGDSQKVFWTRVIKGVVEKAGFLGILICASIPNPLFDLAGITCGHFLVPFWRFFGATLIGKAVIKMLLQKTFVIIAFNEDHFEMFVGLITSIPYVGPYLNEPFREFLTKQKASLHRNPGSHVVKQQSWISWMFEGLVMLMVVYFVVSIIQSMAQNHVKKLKDDKKKSS